MKSNLLLPLPLALLSLVFEIISISSIAQAADGAQVLPKGRFRMSFLYAQTTEMDSLFDSTGAKKLYTDPYHIDLAASNPSVRNYDKVAPLISQLNGLTDLRYNVADKDNPVTHGLIKTSDKRYPLLGDALSLGSLNIESSAVREQPNFLLSYGLSDSFTLALWVPFKKTMVKAKGVISGTNTVQDVLNAFSSDHGDQLDPLTDGLNKVLAYREMDTIQGYLASRGYLPVQDIKQSSIGDTFLAGRWNYINLKTRAGEVISSFQPEVTLPTGSIHAPNDLITTDHGYGAYTVGLSHIANYSPTSWFMLSHKANYMSKLENHRVMRVRTDPSDSFPDASTEELLKMKLGDEYSTAIGTRFTITHWLSVDQSYVFWWKKADIYQGIRADRDYTYLSSVPSNGAASKQDLELGLTLSSVQPFLRNQFPLPGEFNIGAHYPIKGRNQYVTPYYTGELALYF